MTKNPVNHGRAKHIDIKYHHLRDEVERGEVIVEYCETATMLADIMTKELAGPHHKDLTAALGVHAFPRYPNRLTEPVQYDHTLIRRGVSSNNPITSEFRFNPPSDLPGLAPSLGGVNDQVNQCKIPVRPSSYSEHEKAYRFEEIESGRVLVSRDAQFMEDVFDGGRRKYATKEVVIGLPDEDDEDATDEETPSESDEDGSEDEAARDEDFEPGSKRHARTQSLEEAVEVPRAKRYAPQNGRSTLDEMSAAAQESQDFEAAYVVDSVGEMPTTFKSAMESSDAAKWKEACDSEYDSLLKNKTWEVVPLPKGRKAIGNRWVFRVKKNQAGEVERFKARLVAKGSRRSTASTTTRPSLQWPSSRLLQGTEPCTTFFNYAGLDKTFWAEAAMTAIYIKNRLPSPKSPDKTPFEIVYKSKPNVKHMRIFGCKAYVLTPKEKRLKWDPKAREGIFMGYEERSKAYRVYDIEAGQVVISRDVTFDESSFDDSKAAEGEEVNRLTDVFDDMQVSDDSGTRVFTQAGKRKSLLKRPLLLVMSPSPVFPAEDSDYAFAMDAASTTTSRINKFDGTNFHTWKFKMAMVLEERDLWEVTSGEIKLEHCATTLDQTTFKRKSRKALAIICLAMEDSQLPLVRSAKDAYDAWSKLEGHFEKKSLANKLFLRRRFFTTMMAEGDDVLEHINKIKTLAEQLDAVGAPVSEDDLVITLLGSLSESYQFLITALESRADSLSWELVTARLLHEDMKRKEQGGGVDGAAPGQGQAFMTSDNGKRKGRQATANKASACHYCGEQGHWIAKCPVRIRENAERQRPQRANVAQSEDDSGDFLFSVGGGSNTTKSNEVWLVDSGATQHMTSSKKFMKNNKKISPVDVHLADDGVVQAIGRGDIVIKMQTPRGVKKGVLTNVWHIPKLSRDLFSVGRFTKDVGPAGDDNSSTVPSQARARPAPGERLAPSWRGEREARGALEQHRDDLGMKSVA
ncbi:hypothetical protein ON010_g6522 [Phytophthora cinnamomi]|nr:hypothetical protein ON010_g6522 [Phytophthora cinnamomi]